MQILLHTVEHEYAYSGHSTAKNTAEEQPQRINKAVSAPHSVLTVRQT